MKITREFLAKLKPCTDRWENYLDYYSDFDGTWSEFFDLNKISTEDKLWVFTKAIPEIEKQQGDFALICASRAVEKTKTDAVKEFFTLVIFIVQNNFYYLKDSEEYRAADSAAYSAADRAAYRAADSAAYSAADRAADWAAYSATYRAAEREVQLEIAKNLMSER